MKTISGKVISLKPISISKAARVLSTFVSAETGATQAVSAYLRCTSAAFIELTQLHKELKALRSKCKRKKHCFDTTNSEDPNEAVEFFRGFGAVFESDLNVVLGREQSHGGSKGEVVVDNEEIGSVRKKEKKKKKRGDNRGEVEVGESECGGSMVIEEEKRKKRKSVEVEDVERDDSVMRHSKKKKRRSEGDD